MKLLILSDIHGNWPALEAVLEAESDWDEAVSCGDVVDYGPQPAPCLRWVAENAVHMVRGNHDNALALDVDCQCMGTFRAYSLATRSWHRTLLEPSDREFLRRMPALDRFTSQGRRFLMAHATPQGGLFEYLDMDQWAGRIAGIEADFVLLGHTHIQGARTFSTTTVVNVGSVGLARDRRGEACYGVYEDGRMELKRIPYDVGRTAAAIRAAPLPEEVITGLTAVLGGEDRGP